MLVEPTKTGALNDAPSGVLSLASKLVVRGEERLSADFFAILNMVASQWRPADATPVTATNACTCPVHHPASGPTAPGTLSEPTRPSAVQMREQIAAAARQTIPTQIYLGFLTGRTVANSQFAA